ncbi:ultraviolet-B receptor UVR8 isoform X1 [Amborella trichopoda]|uniref:ultraviolet-B receptor UVR8 isoform X1 n=1 Tax=Amborella trichopoda TaxID=13333 RepID=UPI0009BFE4D0|nr:ultraviolet-B receptor UVR8 isoform X1 [Amborella trichopoda]|eukprot:XP_011624150.2 ultraviolet-B receptor UVR8 isoform X1 [Amborella trichopoda]
MHESGGEEVAGKGVRVSAEEKERAVFMWGYLPGASPQGAPLLLPTPVPKPTPEDSWKDVCPGGCGFAMAISESGKLNTWGSTENMGQSYVTAGKHEETPEPYPLQNDAPILKAGAGWAHCVAVTDSGEVYTWGWKECVPTGKLVVDQALKGVMEKDLNQGTRDKTPAFLQTDISEGKIASVSPKSQAIHSVSRSSSGTTSSQEYKGSEEGSKRRRLSTQKQASESSSSNEESFSALPCLVTLSPGVRIASVAAGGRHTLALSVSDIGQVWGWGYGGEGQLGLGFRIRTVSSPHPIACIETSSYCKDKSTAGLRGNITSDMQFHKVPGSYVTAIACGGRHSLVLTDAGALLTFGWGQYGQCGQGSTDDELSPAFVSSLSGVQIQGLAAGLWHTMCISSTGEVYAFGGNQFGQLGTGVDQAETRPRLLDATSLENKHVKMISCGARHTAIITEDAKVFCWGWNKYGQLGSGDAIDRSIPSQVPLDHLYLPTNIACGWWHTLLLTQVPH